MDVTNIIRKYQHQLERCGLTAELRFFHSQNIRAIYYQGHLALSVSLTQEEAREVLHSACMIATTPAHIGEYVTKHLHVLYDGSVAVWGPDSFRKSSIYTA